MTNSVPPGFDTEYWQARFDELRAAHHVPGATLAVLVDGRLQELASGVLHRDTGVPVSTDSVFQIGSIAKVYTATLVLQLAATGELDLDAPVLVGLPEFGTADPDATRSITPRQLLSHTSGMTCDFVADTGRGDDCVARYVAAAGGLALDCPPGSVPSYSSLGYAVLGRLVEVLTGTVWDRALTDRLLVPAGLTQTMTLPEEALRFRVAMGHLAAPDADPGSDPGPASVWNLMPRSAGPYGGVLATAGDVVRMAKLHLDRGVGADGTRVLDETTIAAMQLRQADWVDRWTFGADGAGLGWMLFDWSGVAGFGHDGSTVSQHSYLRVLPGAGVAVALLTNGGRAAQLHDTLVRELLTEVAGVTMPPPFAPPAVPPTVDITPYVGTYRREGVQATVTADEQGDALLRYEFVDGMAGVAPPWELALVPVSEAVFAARGPTNDWMPVILARLRDGSPYLSLGLRVTPRIG